MTLGNDVSSSSGSVGEFLRTHIVLFYNVYSHITADHPFVERALPEFGPLVDS